MAGNTKLIKSFFNDKGIDLRSSDLVREPHYASDIINVDYRKTGAINKRKGKQAKEEDFGGVGFGIYANVNLTTGVITEEAVTLDQNLYKLEEENITVTYSGSGLAFLSLCLDPDTNLFKCVIEIDGTDVLDYSLGVGINEAAPITVANLVSAITAVSDLSASASGNTDNPAAFIEISRSITIDSGGTDIPYNAWTQINTTLTNPLSTTLSNIDSDEFKIASIVNLQNILYVSTGYDSLYKYDGQTFYRAGMPQGTIPTTALGAATGSTGAAVTYILTHLQKDNKGNFIEGIESLSSTPALNAAADKDIDVTITNIINTTGFNTNCAIVAGAQNGVTTITVDDGSAGAHTMQVGDTAYFYDGVSSEYIEREISSIASGTITIAGANVDVLDNAIISNNLRIAVYRKDESVLTKYYLIAEIPNDSFNSTQIYNDTTTTIIAQGNAEYIIPVKEHGLPPKGQYLSVFQTRLMVSGDFENVNNQSWSDIDGAEYFPAGDNQENMETYRGDKITGTATNNNVFFIFKGKSIHMISGNLTNADYRKDEITGGNIGCISHHTIQEVKGKLYFLSTKGVYSLTVGDNEPTESSLIIEPIFRDVNSEYNLSKSVAINWFQKDKYMIMLPAITETLSGDKYTDLDESLILVYDYVRDAWLKWNKYDFTAGVIIYNNSLYMSERRYSSTTTNVESYLYQILDTGDTFDYADHDTAISFIHKTHWEALDEPDVYKKFLRLKLHSLDASINDFETDSFDIDIESQINYNNAESSSFNLDYGSGSGWGDFAWGDDPWSSERIIQLKSKLKNTKAQSIRFIFTNDTVHENILISGWTIEAVFPFKTRVKE